ncbi:MAG TPA: beta-agarase [Planctomycetota bacterium]
MRKLLCLAVLVLFASVAAAGEQVLFDFGKDFDVASVPATNAKVALVPAGTEAGTTPAGAEGGATTAGRDARPTALRIETGHAKDWPGITLRAPGGKWDLFKFEAVSFEIKNTGSNEVTVSCRVDNPGADGVKNCITRTTTLKAGGRETLTVPIAHKTAGGDAGGTGKGGGKMGGKLFGMRGYPLGGGEEGAIDAANITQIIIFTPKPTADHVFEISKVRAEGTYVPPAGPAEGKPFFPFIDTFGQYIHKEWPGKVHSVEEMKQRLADEQKELEAKAGPEDWDQYGGWKSGPTLQATGFFRAEKYKGKWWLVDPEGKLFFSHGVDCVRSMTATPIDERETWFQDFPGAQPEFKEFASKQFALHGYYKGKTPQCFTFAGSNLKRKYGPEWAKIASEMAHKRLRSWGMNTVANWSERGVKMMRTTPYTATVGFQSKLLEGSEGYWGKFRDVFDPEFKAAITKSMQNEKGKTAGDPWCLGFFVDNEIAWGDELSLAIASLRSPPEQAAKKAFIEDLKAKYATIEKLNAAWETKHESWDALLQNRTAPDKKKAGEDLAGFYTKFAEEYFRIIKAAVKEAAPQQLYLGCRFAWVNPRAATAAGKFCDVVSYNIYKKSVAGFQFNGNADVPLMIGEFHFGALDRGVFHTGLVALKNQEERAKTYKDYVQGALRHPNFVGTHWFQYQDEPTTGRSYDEENYQIGLIDEADTPYPETINAVREVGYGMYKYRLEN